MSLKNKNILITGGTGSFGNAFIDYILKHDAKRIIVFSRDELKQSIMQEKYNKIKNIRYFLGDIRDYDRLDLACRNVDILIHAAALKQVPAAEYNPTECIETNINGAKNIIKAALKNKIKKTIALSTDKAVAPINLYGATKLVSDKLFIAANNYSGNQPIKFSVVRYGNVIDSRGSVIPYFKKLIQEGETTLPITHPDSTRFLITLISGVKFVIKSLERMNGGEIFIPKINSYKVTSIAKEIFSNCKFKIIGLRPGEKIHELLFSKDDSENIVEFKDYYALKSSIGLPGNNNFLKSKIGEKGSKIKNRIDYSSDKTTDTKFLKNMLK